MPRKTINTNVDEKKQKGKRLALLICNGNFPNIQNADLTGPIKDAKNLELVLSDSDIGQFSVQTLMDKGLIDVRREIARICSDASEKDILLIYYSGRGITGKDGSLYLLVADADSAFLDATALDTEFILIQLRQSACRKIILLVDSCHSGAFFNQNRGIPNGLYAITACGADEYSYDTLQGGAFTCALCAGLLDSNADADGDGRVSIDELHEYTKNWLADNNFQSMPQKWEWNVPEPIYVSNVQRPVFLSYAREDKEKADQLSEALKSEGISVWIDSANIHEGNWKDRVMEGLNKARALIILLTPAS